ncbi:type II secretion system protein XpsN [Xanthomonas citri pv. malvacearum]|uniref:General secretion pathway protein GspN n=1 Tax=Xanthomonas campestris pv. malvacearum TaxID=86040 RepID=A0AA45BWH8_XANCM|nr:type II secretion system protein XpsN [Xanthomonas citri]AOL20732.1 general secretion pathway protein GspN [Xanthomonas citri pv. malvacearum]ASN00078.1 general secretion pathway protein GspN [Xanthomonas citri pv. malvacearum]ASN08267.1 general secretion pathway protein GspN [Xanthomonas citri pv. malvacearum]ASY83423.1 general secretion pathway protein GspN [Xanthomonas citri pv. malvacearum]ASY90032.1 general secretion pathway protein GspN [Xanthomonas citri pv. malvacearum]
MRLDMIGLRTWLLATVVGWALLVCVLAVAGLGKRVELLPDDPALVQRLPTLPAPAPERLGPFEKYSEIAAHPAFAEDRLPHPFFLSGNDGGTAASTVRLTGVLLTDNFKMATLTLDPQDSVRVQLGGEAVKGWRLLALQPRSATVEGPSGTQTLELHVFNGQGGQPPTANAAARGAATATPPVPSPDAAALAPPQPPQPQPQPVAPVQQQQPGGQTPPTVPPQRSDGAQEAPRPSDDQMRAIRERIEARRRQLQQQRQSGSTPGQTQ